MMTDNQYYREFYSTIKDFDILIKEDVTKTLTQSISDLDLENSNFYQICILLGTPKEFVNEYIIEKGDKNNPPNLIRYYINRYRELDHNTLKLQISFMIIILLQLLTFITTPMLIPFQRKRVYLAIMTEVTAYVIIMILIFLMTSVISRKIQSRTRNFDKIYYNSFKILVFVIYANLFFFVSYVWSVNNYFKSIYGLTYAGHLIFQYIPIGILSGLKSTMKHYNGDSTEHVSNYYNTRDKKVILWMKNLIVFLTYLFIYNHRYFGLTIVGYNIAADYTTFYIPVIISYTTIPLFLTVIYLSSISIIYTVEYLKIYQSYPKGWKNITDELMKVLIIIIFLHFIGNWMSLTFGGYY